jgi:hypothetical protein
MVKHRINLIAFLFLLLFGAALPAQAQLGGEGNYTAKYKGSNVGGTSCTTKTMNNIEAQKLVTQSIDVNLNDFRDDMVDRIEEAGSKISSAVMTASATITHDIEVLGVQLKKAEGAALAAKQKEKVDEESFKAMQAARLSEPEKAMTTGLSMYQPDLVPAARQSEMVRYINELNNVPLDNKFRNAEGYPLPGYVDTSKTVLSAMGQEFRNYVRFFCDVRSLNGKLASTRFLEFNGNSAGLSEYWCGQGRNVLKPDVNIDKNTGQYIPLEGEALKKYVTGMVKREEWLSYDGDGKSYLINAPKNVADLYFEPHTLKMGNNKNNDAMDIYEKAEQQFARFVIGRANDLNNTSDFSTGIGQRQFMDQQGRIAKLSLARYPFAEMFARKLPTMPPSSAGWAADMIEKNIGDCKKPDPSYKSLCDLTNQLRKKGQISESEFYDVLFNRQFQGMAFTKSTIGMTSGQLKRMQANLLGLQLALNYQRNRLKQEQLLLIAAISANDK